MRLQKPVYLIYADIEEYSRQTNEQMRALRAQLRDMVLGLEEYTRHREIKAYFNDTGDGFLLAFFDDPEAPLRCAIAIHEQAQIASIPIRLGVHSGLCTLEQDVQGNPAPVGDSINMGQRVMSCASAGEILTSVRYAEDLRGNAEWRDCFVDEGERTVKNNGRIRVCRFRPRLVFEAPGGAMLPNTRFHIPRECDKQLAAAVKRKDNSILIKGPRQVGKTTLLSRGLNQAYSEGIPIVYTDIQSFSENDLVTLDSLFMNLCRSLKRELELEVSVSKTWDSDDTPSNNLSNFLSRHILATTDKPFIWALDEVDRLFPYQYKGDVFGLFRSWYNRRATDHTGRWGRLILILCFATEPNLLITDLNQSPFNVGTNIQGLSDFTLEQMKELNDRYDNILEDFELPHLKELTNGHPYLTQTSFFTIKSKEMNLQTLISDASEDEGPFGGHLRRLYHVLKMEPDLADTTRIMLRGRPPHDISLFYRLRSLGLIHGETPDSATFRCRIYEEYFNKVLF